jgi:F0F1-type ATP synthase assembly protein I
VNRIISDQSNTTKKKDRSKLSSIREVSRIGSFGLMMGAAIFLGYFLGNSIDLWLGTYPWFMLLFLILFMIGAFINFFQNAGLMSKNSRDKKKNRTR